MVDDTSDPLHDPNQRTRRRQGRSLDEVHELVAARLRRSRQRYTSSRRALIELLVACNQPLTIYQILERTPSMPQSSAYRHMAALEQAAAVCRIVTTDDHAHFELAPDLTEPHHHLICTACGLIVDFTFPKTFDNELERRLDGAARRHHFVPVDLRLDVPATCMDCYQR